jgi:glycosyltransferase involved in cell wall biosynthesis
VTRRELLSVTTSPLPVRGQITDGPGFRMWNLLQEVARSHDVRILSLYESLHQGERAGKRVEEGGVVVETASHRPGGIARSVRELRPDALFLPWSSAGFLGGSNRNIPTIIDYVGPGLLESFAQSGRIPLPLVHLKLASFWYGDLFVTTTARERYYLIGLMAASRRLSVTTFSPRDPLIRVVRMTPPFDPPAGNPHARTSASEPLVVLLSGAFLPWYDYEMVEKALSGLSGEDRSGLRVLVLGGNPRMPDVERKVREVLGKAGGGGVCEFLGLVPFQDRVRVYREADVGLSMPSLSVEDELSSRTRVVDYLWARLPVLSEGHDEYSSEIIAAGAGFRFDHSASSLTRVLQSLRSKPQDVDEARLRCENVLERSFNTRKEVLPILEFLDEPRVTMRRPSLGASLEMSGIWISDLIGNLRNRIE